MDYRKFISLSKDQIESEIDKADNKLHELRCTRAYTHSPSRDAQEKRLQKKIECLYEALRYKQQRR